MNDQAWDSFIDKFDERYGLKSVKKFDEPMPDDQHLTRQVMRVEFSAGGHDYRVERISSPRVVEQKTFYHRTGQANQVKNIYDQTEQSNRVVFYRVSTSGEWVETEPERLFD